MGIFSFGNKDEAPARRGSRSGSGRRSNDGVRVERRSRRPDRSGDAEAMLLDPTLPEKQRARRRLVGAIALVIAAVIVLPMILDTHPKPVTDDIAIDIPSRPAPKASARDAAADAQDGDATQAGVAPDNPPAADAVPVASGLASTDAARSAAAPKSAPPTQTAQAAAPSGKQGAQASAQTKAQTPAGKAPAATTAQRSAVPSDTDVEPGSSSSGDAGTPAAPPGARYALQLGSFTDDANARNWEAKLKAAGVPAYTERRKDADGKTRTLLRAGPFPDRAAASAAIAKVRSAGLGAGANNGGAD